MLVDLSRIHPDNGVAQKPKQIFNKLLSFFQRVRVELLVVVRLQCFPSAWFPAQIFLKYLQFYLEPVYDLDKQGRVIEYVGPFGDYLQNQQGSFLANQVNFVYSILWLDSNQMHEWLYYLGIQCRRHIACCQLNNVLQEC